MFRKILVPFDGSKPSENAFEHAASIAMAARNAEVILFYVVQEIPQPPVILESRFRSPKTGEETSISAMWKEIHQDLKNKALEMLKERTKQVKDFAIRTSVAIGAPADKIIKFAKDENVDLIVIGNVGLGRFKLKALGSVSRAVSEHAHCPVMIVH
jgi:nucleotide-binding universal stress UspA family protein